MWSEVATILRYSSLNIARSSNRRRFRGSERYPLLSFFARNLSVAVVFGVMITVFFISMMKNQSAEIFNYVIEGTGVSLGELLVSPWLFIGTIVFLASAAPGMTYNLFDSPDVEFLLTLPVRRSSIVMVKNLEILPYYSMGLAMIFPAYIILGYFRAGWIGIFVGFLAALIYLGLLWALSAFLASVLNVFMGRMVARRIATMAYFASIMLLVFAYNYFMPDLTKTNSIDALLKYSGFMTSPLFPYSWFLRALVGRHFWWISSGITLLFVYGAARLSSNLEFSRGRSHVKKGSFLARNRAFPVYRKDLLLLRRDPQLLYMLAYPVVFAMIFLLQREATAASFFYVQLTAIYSGLTSALLLRQEFLIWPVPMTFPVTMRALVLPKIVIPTVAYSTIYTFLVLALLFIGLMEPWMGLFIPIVVLIIFSSTLLGAWIFLRRPNRPVKGRNVFTTVEVLMVQGITLLWTFSTLGAIQLGIARDWSFYWLLKYIAPVISISSMIYFVIKTSRKMRGFNL
ncbi:MAG: type transport system permease protein [Thermotogota bacterium]|nr:type transport system permease protein [Thermotogota bacterium]